MQLPNLLALQTSSYLKHTPQEPYREDGFPDTGEVLCILVNHFAHAADELGPGEPLAGRQLQAEGLKEAEEQRTVPCIASLSPQLPAAGWHDIPRLLPACCLAARLLCLAKTASPCCQLKVNIKTEEWFRLGNYGTMLGLPLPDTQRSTFRGFIWVTMPHRGQQAAPHTHAFGLSCCDFIFNFHSSPLPLCRHNMFLAEGFDLLLPCRPCPSSCLQADIPSMSLPWPWQSPSCPRAFHLLAALLFSWHSSPK